MEQKEVTRVVQMPQWERVKAEYVTGQASVRALGQKYQIPYWTISGRCTREGWVAQRADYRQKMRPALPEQAADPRQLAQLRGAADRMAQVLADACQQVEYVRRDAAGRAAADTKAMRDMVVILKDLTAVMRDLYDLPGAEDAQRMRLAEEKFKLEQARHTEDEVQTVQVILGEAEELAE